MKRWFEARPLFWALLALPGLPMFAAALQGADVEDLLRPTGETSARLIIVALALTPLARLFPASGAVRWLMRRRRAIGVAAFAYGALHSIFYVVAMRVLDDMLAEFGATGIWTGWLALALLVPLAVTSNRAAQRALGATWKRLQRLAYPAAVLTLVHWLFVHDGIAAALAHFGPLVLLQVIRAARSPAFKPSKEAA